MLKYLRQAAAVLAVFVVLNFMARDQAVAGEKSLIGYSIEASKVENAAGQVATRWVMYRMSARQENKGTVNATTIFCKEAVRQSLLLPRGSEAGNFDESKIIEQHFFPPRLQELYQDAMSDKELREAKIYNGKTFTEALNQCEEIDSAELINDTIDEYGNVDGATLMLSVAKLVGYDIGTDEIVGKLAKFGREKAGRGFGGVVGFFNDSAGRWVRDTVGGEREMVPIPALGTHDFFYFNRLQTEVAFMHASLERDWDSFHRLFPMDFQEVTVPDRDNSGQTQKVRAYALVTHAQFAIFLSNHVRDLVVHDFLNPRDGDYINVARKAWPDVTSPTTAYQWWPQLAVEKQAAAENGEVQSVAGLKHVFAQRSQLAPLAAEGLAPAGGFFSFWHAESEVAARPVEVPHAKLRDLYCDTYGLYAPPQTLAHQIVSRVGEAYADWEANDHFFCTDLKL